MTTGYVSHDWVVFEVVMFKYKQNFGINLPPGFGPGESGDPY